MPAHSRLFFINKKKILLKGVIAGNSSVKETSDNIITIFLFPSNFLFNLIMDILNILVYNFDMKKLLITLIILCGTCSNLNLCCTTVAKTD